MASGEGVTLLALAQRIRALTGSASVIEMHPVRDYDVARFFGASALAAGHGWAPVIGLDAGLARLAQALAHG